MVLVHRLLALRFELSFPSTMTMELWITACLMAHGGITVVRFLWWAALALALGVLASVIRPDHIFLFYCVFGITSLATVAFFARRLVKS